MTAQLLRDAPAAIAPLAVLPVFLILAGRRALVVGGSAAAAWKAELLAAAGAAVTVVAVDVSPELAAIAARSATGAAPISVCASLDVLDGFAVAVIDAVDDDEATIWSERCREAGIPHNVIDRPAFGDFQFGSIVNRSPAVIGISTGGAAPILGQAIRQRIEAVLPSGLAAWAKLAAAVRERVARLLAPGAPRRRFWERLATDALAGKLAPDEDEVASWVLATAHERQADGHVTLVGAGPGDASLLTLAAVRALQSADVILYDALVTPEVLELARREAKRISVGKRAGRHSCGQDDIHALMVREARAGGHVVRLKAGDPMIFGRAGEEIEALETAGIPVAVIPGITAACALASRLGASLTHRDHAHSLRFVTGHGRSGALAPDLDWRGLADARTTLIVYMAGATASAFARRLIANGLAPDTPAVLAEALFRPDERIARLSLRDLARGATAAGDGPILLGVGSALARASPESAGFYAREFAA